MKAIETITESRMANILRELEHKRQENKRLRARLPKSKRGSSIVERAVIDAEAILVEAFTSGNTGRDYMLKAAGMKRSAHRWAIAFLRYAGIVAPFVHGKSHWQQGIDFNYDDQESCFMLYRREALRIDDDPNGYQTLHTYWQHGYLKESVPGQLNAKSKTPTANFVGAGQGHTNGYVTGQPVDHASGSSHRQWTGQDGGQVIGKTNGQSQGKTRVVNGVSDRATQRVK